MATNKNIIMKQFNGTDYDTLYPKTVAAQIDDVYSKDETYPKSQLYTRTQLYTKNETYPKSQLYTQSQLYTKDETYPKSQLYTQSQLYTKEQILTNATKTLYSLGADAVPDDIFKMLGEFRAVIHVFTMPGASVSMSKGGKTFTATADSKGTVDLYPSEFGEWTVTAGSASKTINIDAIAVYNLALSDLKSTSWSQVANISKMGLASTLFNIGDEKTLTINGESYTAVIIGFDHDTPANITAYGRNKAGITWQLKNCLNTTYKMNSSDTNSGGWTSCEMRTSTMATLLSQIASDLKNVIVKVKKLSSAGDKSTTINTTEDSLFLLSEAEIFGSIYEATVEEGSRYEYYQAGNSKVKTVGGSASNWWLRSPSNGKLSTSYDDFCFIDNKGESYSQYATQSFGVSFGFCV